MKKKREVVTFKVDEALSEAMNGIDNRSEFIRSAILSALDGGCPLCKGTGILTPEQQKHWKAFQQGHSVEECGQCRAVHLVCDAGVGASGVKHAKSKKRKRPRR
jgi:hypothetical protein